MLLIQWLEKTFLTYLDDWERSVNCRQGFTKAEKKRMMLSAETLLGMTGIHVYECVYLTSHYSFYTVNSFVELICFLFSQPDVKDNRLAFLSNHLCQDPLEKYFGAERKDK